MPIIDPDNPPANYEVFKIDAGALYIDRVTFAVHDGYFVINVCNQALEESERLSDWDAVYDVRAYLRRLMRVKPDMDYPMPFVGGSTFGFGPEEGLDD